MVGDNISPKPMLLYLPDFDGTILSPFLQFPSLEEEFYARAMEVDMNDRFSSSNVEYLLRECSGADIIGQQQTINRGLGVIPHGRVLLQGHPRHQSGNGTDLSTIKKLRRIT